MQVQKIEFKFLVTLIIALLIKLRKSHTADIKFNTMSTAVAENTFIDITRSYFYLPIKHTTAIIRLFRLIYALPPYNCVSLWNQLLPKFLIRVLEATHVLSALQFLKAYSSEHHWQNHELIWDDIHCSEEIPSCRYLPEKDSQIPNRRRL